jgi:hypothetical protein
LTRPKKPRSYKAVKLIRASADQGYEEARDYMRTIVVDGLVDVEVCAWCAKEIIGAKKCGGCQCVCYCNEACQKEDWKTHKMSCRPENIRCVNITLVI